MGRNVYSTSTSTVSSSVGKKKPVAGFKRKNLGEEVETRQTGNDGTGISNSSSALLVQSVKPTIVVNRKPVRLKDPPPAAPLLIKKITGNIRKWTGCAKPLSTRVEGFWRDDNAFYCCGRYEAYYYWIKDSKFYQLSSGVRHYHINPVCTQMFRTLNNTISLEAKITPTDSICQIVAQCFGTTLS